MKFDLIDLKCFEINSMDGAQIYKKKKNSYKKKFLKEWDEFLDFFIEKYKN